MAKNLPNIGKPVPEMTDPANIKVVSDAIEALDTALGAAPSTLTTTAKTLVGAINELEANNSYEKGTFVPSLRFTSGAGSITAIRSANYIKINSLIYFTLYLQLDITVATGAIYISGFPYPNKGGQTAVAMAHQTIVDATDAIINNDSEIQFYNNASTAQLSSTGTRYVMLSGTYITD